jgi:hypothetical protein
MQEYEFDPPLALQGDIVVATLDDAAAFARSLISPDSRRQGITCCDALNALIANSNKAKWRTYFASGQARRACSSRTDDPFPSGLLFAAKAA